MTSLEKEVQNLPKLQKISLMEQLWSEISQDAHLIEIPDWHIKELELTEKRIKEGKEHFIDWELAKEAIRNA